MRQYQTRDKSCQLYKTATNKTENKTARKIVPNKTRKIVTNKTKRTIFICVLKDSSKICRKVPNETRKIK